MTEPARNELLRALEDLLEVCPEYRLGQLIANLAFLARGDQEGAIWNVEDEELLAQAREHLAVMSARRAPVA